MPGRVRDLALEITDPYPSRFDKVKAVERYFRSNEFEYETTDVAVPTGDQDYVDQFLFETMKGYCDNFSTAMVALLRSIDIPARWVKGYTEGEFVDVAENSRRIFEVTNNNAHSWVEVYFPGVGWVTYEPTSGFSNPYSFVYQSAEENVGEDGEEQTPEQPESPQTEEPERPELRSSTRRRCRWYHFFWEHIRLITFLQVVSSVFSSGDYCWRHFVPWAS